MDMRFGTWNVRSMYRAGSLRAVAEEISKYRVIQEELPPLMELISEDILSKKCHINLGPILNIYRVTFVHNWNFSKFQF
jgi:hypothetical protein